MLAYRNQNNFVLRKKERKRNCSKYVTGKDTSLAGGVKQFAFEFLE